MFASYGVSIGTSDIQLYQIFLKFHLEDSIDELRGVLLNVIKFIWLLIVFMFIAK